MVTTLIIIAYVIVGIWEIRPMYKSKEYKEIAVYMVLYSAAFVISVLLSLGVKIPSPAEPIANIVEAIVGKQ